MSNPWGEPESGDEGPPSEPPYIPPDQAGQHGGFTPPQAGQPGQPGQQPGQQGQPGQPGQQGQPGGGFVPPQSGYPGQPGYGQGPPYTPAGAGAYGVAPARTSQASTAIALSISGLVITVVLGFCCGPFGVIGLALCGVGAYLGTQELRAIDAGTADPIHRSQAKGAQVIGLVGIGIFAVLILLGVAWVLLSVVSAA